MDWIQVLTTKLILHALHSPKSQYSREIRDEHYLKHIDTTYFAQKFDLYVLMFTRLH